MKNTSPSIGYFIAVFISLCNFSYAQDKIYTNENIIHIATEQNLSKLNTTDSISFPVSTNWLRVKTNVLYLAATVANIGGEFRLSEQLSLDVPFAFSPYNIKDSRKLRVLGLQTELRYWFDKAFSNHFIGLHTHVAWFNTADFIFIAFDEKKRYQDSDNKPLWGFGASYGYNLNISKHFDLEFTLGLGYAKIYYDTYYNVKNGAKFASDTRNYWGITRLGLSVSYKF